MQKYHVDTNSKYSVYNHQYQQNVSAPYTEGVEVRDAYEELGILESNFNFIIPVYENMPSAASEKPGRKLAYVTEDVIVQTASSSLNIRSMPSTANLSYIKGTAPKGTRLIRIEKAQEASENGIYWDKVAYNTGSKMIIGYASREYLADTAINETTQEEKTIGVMCNLRNGPSTTNTYVKQILQPGTKVTVIDKILYKVDGHNWYRVKLQDGTQGYISSAYIKTEENNTEIESNSEQTLITDEKYKIEENNIKVAPDIKITDIQNATLIGEVFGTGAKIKIEEKEYTVIMLGDVSGDGNITPADYVKIKNHIMGTTTLEEIYKSAADVNNDTSVTPADYVKVKNHIMKVSNITLNI